MADDETRVKIWNSFCELAWSATKRCSEIADGQPPGIDLWGGMLSDDRRVALAALTLTALAIDARANHLIEVLVDSQRLKADIANAALWLPPKHKWFMLPALAGRPTALDAASGPQQAIAMVLSRRNDLMHVKFDEIDRLCPSSSEMVNWWNRVVDGLEEMSVLLDRTPTFRADFVNKLKL